MSTRDLSRSARIRKLMRDRRGAAAVEFAVILPVLLLMFFGTAELSQGLAIDRKVITTARTLSDLVAQHQTVNAAQMDDILNAATAIMAPYPTDKLHLTVTAVNVDNDGVARVGWSSERNGIKRVKNDVVSLKKALAIPNSQLIWAEVVYDYKPQTASAIIGELGLNERFYASPRESATVVWKP